MKMESSGVTLSGEDESGARNSASHIFVKTGRGVVVVVCEGEGRGRGGTQSASSVGAIPPVCQCTARLSEVAGALQTQAPRAPSLSAAATSKASKVRTLRVT
jgi:hypothetical protein